METNSYVLVRDFWLERNLWMPGSVKDLLVEIKAVNGDLVLFPLTTGAHLVKRGLNSFENHTKHGFFGAFLFLGFVLSLHILKTPFSV